MKKLINYFVTGFIFLAAVLSNELFSQEKNWKEISSKSITIQEKNPKIDFVRIKYSSRANMGVEVENGINKLIYIMSNGMKLELFDYYHYFPNKKLEEKYKEFFSSNPFAWERLVEISKGGNIIDKAVLSYQNEEKSTEFNPKNCFLLMNQLTSYYKEKVEKLENFK